MLLAQRLNRFVVGTLTKHIDCYDAPSTRTERALDYIGVDRAGVGPYVNENGPRACE